MGYFAPYQQFSNQGYQFSLNQMDTFSKPQFSGHGGPGQLPANMYNSGMLQMSELVNS